MAIPSGFGQSASRLGPKFWTISTGGAAAKVVSGRATKAIAADVSKRAMRLIVPPQLERGCSLRGRATQVADSQEYLMKTPPSIPLTRGRRTIRNKAGNA